MATVAPAATAGAIPADPAKQFFALGLTDKQVAGATGLDPAVVAALRTAA